MPRLTPFRFAVAVVSLAGLAFASSAFGAVTVSINCTAPNLTPITFAAEIGETVTFQMTGGGEGPGCNDGGGWEFGNGNGLYYGVDRNITEAGYMTFVGTNATNDGMPTGSRFEFASDWYVWANSSGGSEDASITTTDDTTITTTLGATDGAGTRLVPGATVAEIDTALSSWNTETGVQNPIVWRGPRTTAPTAPVSVTAVAGDASAVVSWSAPESDGGSAITGYTVTARPGGATCQTATTTCTVTGLSNGTAYTVSVIARNEIGPSPASADSAPVTPSAAEGGTSTTATPSVHLSQSQRRNGILVRFGGDVRITLQCPVAGAACAMTGTFTTTSPAARSGMSSFATTTTLASFKNVRVPAGSTKAITVRLFPTPLHYLQANGVTTIGAVLTVRRTLGSAITSSSQKVRLRIPRVHMAVTG